MTRAELRPEEGQAMTSSALRQPIRQFDRPHSQPPPEFPCGATQRDGKSPQNARQSGEYRSTNLPLAGATSPAVNREVMILVGTPRLRITSRSGSRNSMLSTDSGAMFL